jgi:oligoribonuclease NrnB/cAMP/cGMP phosphodiesterase (DHH superfamily)
MSKKYFIFSDSDLDGICSYITLCWFLSGKPDIPYKLSTVSTFKQDFENWKKTDSLSNYDRVFFLDIDISEHADLVDKKNVVVIDHHKTHVPNVNRYTKAKTIIQEYTSCTKLIFKHFEKAKELDKHQKILIALADDYDCYALKVPQSYDLHVVYYQTQNSTDRSKVQKFIDSFGMGFKGFTQFQKNIVKLHRETVNKTIAELQVFGGNMQVQGQHAVVRSTVCERAINEVADHLIRNMGADVAIVVNPNSGRVSFRRKKESAAVDVSQWAAKLVDGGGHEYAAGGSITEAFMAFTQLLKPIANV